MKTIFKAVLTAAFAVLSTTSLHAMDPVTAGNLSIEPGWARASATPVAKAGAAFFVIHNKGGSEDTLVGAASGVAGKVEVHTHKHENGVMKMMPAGDISIPADGMVMMKPGGLHVMLMRLNAPLIEGEHFQVILHFENAGEVTVPVTVMSVAAKGPGKGHGSAHGTSHGKSHGKSHGSGHGSNHGTGHGQHGKKTTE